VTCDVLGTDAGQESWRAATSAFVHPAAVYAALELDGRGVVAPGRRLEPRVLAVRPDGTRERRPVRLALFVLRTDAKGRWLTREVDPSPVSTCEAHPADEPASCTLIAPSDRSDRGAYFELRASVFDEKGHEARASQILQPGPPPSSSPSSRPSAARSTPLAQLVTDKPTYAAGDQAALTMTSPFARGHLLLTLEGAGILEHFVRPIGKEPVTIQVPVDASVAPSLEAQVTLVAPLSDKTLSTRTSAAEVSVRSPYEVHALSVTVRPEKAMALPGEEIDVDVDVRHSDGSPAEASVTLYAADEGTLILAHYTLPDPLDELLRYSEHDVVGGNTRLSLAHTLDWSARAGNSTLGVVSGGGSVSVGGVAGMGPGGGTSLALQPAARHDMRQTAFFFPALLTDAQGHVKRRVRLPDAVTTHRLMAVAVTKPGDAGSGQAPVVTQVPLQVRPSLPRVIRLGDRFQIAALVANNGASLSRDCLASIAIDGKTLVARGPTTQPVTLPAQGSARLTFDVEAAGVSADRSASAGGEGGAVGVVTTTLQCGALGDAVASRYAVETPIVLDVATAFGATSGRVEQPLANLDDVNKSVGGLEVSLSSSPLAGLGTALEQLVNYPYECVEQTVSRLVPLLSLRELARALKVKLPDDLDGVTRATVAKLEAAQQADGGFQVWPSSPSAEESLWLSAYATWGLEEARRHHVPANDAALDRARHHLLDGLRAPGNTANARAAAPFALDVLAETATSSPGSIDLGSLRVIADQWFDRREVLPAFSKALLLHAMASLEADPARVAKLVGELAAPIQIDGHVARYVGTEPLEEASFDSPLRTSALVLRALVAAAPKHPLVTPLALGLVHDRQAGTWRTTQETAWALLALDAYRRTHEENAGKPVLGGLVKLGGETLWRTEFPGVPGVLAADARVSFPLPELLASKAATSSSTLSFEAIGDNGAPLYYQALLRTAKAVLPAQSLLAGFDIQRRYQIIPSRLLSGTDAAAEGAGPPQEQAIREGDLILVRVDVATTFARRLVVIDDALPGGFETLDPLLQGAPEWLQKQLDRAEGPVKRTENRDDRTLFFVDELAPGRHSFTHLMRAMRAGTFVSPPARVEEMYNPETFGRTGASFVVIAPR
jgi:alpha-2-macroglobulin